MAAWGHWIQEAAAEGLARQLGTPLAATGPPDAARRLPRRNSVGGMAVAFSSPSPAGGEDWSLGASAGRGQSAGGRAGGGGSGGSSTAGERRQRSSTALAVAMRQRGGVKRSQTFGKACEAASGETCEDAGVHKDGGAAAGCSAGPAASGVPGLRLGGGARAPLLPQQPPNQGAQGGPAATGSAPAASAGGGATLAAHVGEFQAFLHRGTPRRSGGARSQAEIIAEGVATKCRSARAARCVAMAARVASGRPIEDMLGALLGALRDDDCGEEAPSTSTAGLEGTASSLQTPTSTPPASPELRDDASRHFGDERAALTSRRSTMDSSTGGSFAAWLDTRPPLLRFDKAAGGLAWDFPLAKAEKHELLLLQLFAQETERHAEMEVIRRRASVAPSPGL